ncbi:cobalamin-dependent protein [Streptomyces sp. NPDC007100]|uniref:cobalamin B12-binding domain-containing protein n=1 Tax=Streptomyces sp. NPDC007100 TaxID=3155602 RepID=UPI0033CD97AF
MSNTLTRPGRRIILSSVSSDSHTWNLVFLQLLLEENGHEVINLGACVPDDLLVESVRRFPSDAVVISSVNGHGFLDGERMIRALRTDPDTRDVPAVIGGKLGIDGSGDHQRAARLVEAGFDAVFTDATDPSALVSHLAALPAPAARLARAGRP